MIVVFLGPPGAGKGTQCKLLVEKYGLVHMSSGDILRRERKENTELGQKAQHYMDTGGLVPDDLIVAMMMKEMKTVGGKGFVLDGFPRTLGQAQALDSALTQEGQGIDVVLDLQVDDEKLEERITGRRSCAKCGTAYHVKFKPPQVAEKCDKPDCADEALVQRPDDTSDVVRNRIKTYHEQTAPLQAYYGEKGLVREVDGNQDIEQVTQALIGIMDDVCGAA